MPDKVGDELDWFMFPQWWLIFQRERNFEFIHVLYGLNGDKGLEKRKEHDFSRLCENPEHNLHISHLDQKDVR